MHGTVTTVRRDDHHNRFVPMYSLSRSRWQEPIATTRCVSVVMEMLREIADERRAARISAWLNCVANLRHVNRALRNLLYSRTCAYAICTRQDQSLLCLRAHATARQCPDAYLSADRASGNNDVHRDARIVDFFQLH